MRLLLLKLCLINLWLRMILGQVYQQHDEDLDRFISRPDLRPPRFRINIMQPGISAGYIFVAPYADLAKRSPSTIYQPKQMGPHIFDKNGELIWSSGDIFSNRIINDFKVGGSSSGSNLTMLMGDNEHETYEKAGVGLILDNTLNIRERIHVPRGSRTVDMHEFSLLPGGKTALIITSARRYYQTETPLFRSWIHDLGFVEVEIATKNTIFEWWASDHLHPLESQIPPPPLGGNGMAWDFFHLNSIDKDADGDYLISARHTWTIYKISGTDGTILWRLGGKNSSFQQMDLNFSWQHNARFHSKTQDTETITFLNNASNGLNYTDEFSSALTVILNTSRRPMTATVVQSLRRPDQKRTDLRGNVQKLSNSNTFVCWSENSYISEFDSEGQLIFSARFRSRRFATYRAYKFNFTSAPDTRPDLVCSAYGVLESSATTACYVSWNGATEVDSWRFLSVWMEQDRKLHYALLGNMGKQGFETSFMVKGYHPMVVAEALDVNAKSLRNSTMVKTQVPRGAGFMAHKPYPVYNEWKDIESPDSKLNLGPAYFPSFFNQEFGSCKGSTLPRALLYSTLGAATITLIFVIARRVWHRFAWQDTNKLRI